MARGAEAKQRVADKLAQAFGADYIGEVDKKYYVWTTENGERIQIAISMTCPKVPVVLDEAIQNGDWNFEDEVSANKTVVSPISTPVSTEISESEKQNIAALMERLGL